MESSLLLKGFLLLIEDFGVTHKQIKAQARLLLPLIPELFMSEEKKAQIYALMFCLSRSGPTVSQREIAISKIQKLCVLEKDDFEDEDIDIPY